MLGDLGIHLSYPLAFLAGLASILSPCVFPLVPAYLAHLSGRALQTVPAGAPERAVVAPREGALATAGAPGAAAALMHRRPVRVDGARQRTSTPRLDAHAPLLANGAAFVVGFSSIFIAFFYVFSALRVTLFIHHQHEVNLAAGIIVIVLALQTVGVVRIGWLMRERRLHITPRGTGLLPSFLLGVTFAAGWTPCIGPQLGAILSVATGGDFTGLPVMVVYCLGLAIPFLLIAALTERLRGVIRTINRNLRVVNIVAGVLLLAFGVLLVSDHFTFFNRYAVQSPFDL